jgi:hypothetical protein
VSFKGLISHPVTQRFASAGAIGGAAAFILTAGINDAQMDFDPAAYRRRAALTFALTVLPICVALVLTDRRRRGKTIATTGDITTLVVVGVIGIVSGYLAQIAYEHLLPELDALECLQMSACIDWQTRLARTVGWAIAGLGTGLGVGYGFRDKDRVLNTALGGLVGGLLGGVLFDYITEALDSNDGTWSRGVGLIVIGTLIGASVSTVEQLRASSTSGSVSTYAPGQTALGQRSAFPPPPPRPRP